MSMQRALPPRSIPIPHRLPLVKRWGIQAVLLLVSVFVLLPSFPPLLQTPDIDSGTFLYIGSRILNGDVPYRDIWDHKPPLVFFINALGLAVGQGRGGVWLLEVISLSAASWLLFAFLRRYFGRVPALFAVLCLLANWVFVSENGNLTEVYALPYQALMLFCLSKMQDDAHSARYPLIIGAALGLSVSLKQTLVGTGLAVLLFLLIQCVLHKDWRGLFSLLWVGPGFALVWIAWIVYFAANGALADFWDQAFLYNFFYSDVTNPDRIHAAVDVIQNLFRYSWFFWLGMLAWLVVPPFLVLNEADFRALITGRLIGVVFIIAGGGLILNGVIDDRTGRLYNPAALSSYRLALIACGVLACGAAFFFLSGRLRGWVTALAARFSSGGVSGLLAPLLVALIELPIQLLLSGLSGRNYYHYFIPLLPSLTILIALLAWALYSGNCRPGISRENRFNVVMWLLILSIPLLVTGLVATVKAIRPTELGRVASIVSYVQANSSQGEKLLQWGMNSRLNYLAGRSAPTRYAYQQPLFTPGYGKAEYIALFLSELEENSPALIVDTADERLPFVYADRREECEQLLSDEFITQQIIMRRKIDSPEIVNEPIPYYPAEMKQVYRWICENYEKADFTADGWTIYRSRSGNQ